MDCKPGDPPFERQKGKTTTGEWGVLSASGGELVCGLKNKELRLEKKFSLIVYSSEFLEFLYIDPYLFNNFCLSLCC